MIATITEAAAADAAEKAANIRKAADLLITSFVWETSEKGLSYWANVHDSFMAMARAFDADAERLDTLALLEALDG